MAEPASDRTRVRRLASRGAYDRETIHAILDEGMVCHVGFVDQGQPFVIPTGYARDGNRLLLHGSAANRMLRVLSEGAPFSLAVTLLDGLVLAKSAFHHSMNYRSVVVLGRARGIEDREAKLEAMRILVEHIVPGRWADCRQPDDKELKATLVLEIPLDEASAKVRTGPPKDDAEDLAQPHWAGVIPLKQVPQTPVAAPDHAEALLVPEYASRYRRG